MRGVHRPAPATGSAGAAQRTILFLDEIHRFNKAQQDALLPAVEEGLITLIGSTTENPYFEVNSALLSRSQVYELEPLDGGRPGVDRAARRRRSSGRDVAGRRSSRSSRSVPAATREPR